MIFSSISPLLIGIFFLQADANEGAVGNANDYIDEILQNLQNEPSMLSKFDPLDIPDVDEAEFKLHGGQVRGLSSLYRNGDCTLDFDGEVIYATAQVAVKNISIVNLHYRAKAGLIWMKGHATAKVSDLAVKMDVSAKDGKAKLDSFKVTHLGKYKVEKITGASKALNWLLKLIVNAVAKKSRGKIIDAMETNVAKAVGNLLEKYQLPHFEY